MEANGKLLGKLKCYFFPFMNNKWELMVTNGERIAKQGKFKRYVLPFVINGNSMVNDWKKSNSIFHYSSSMGDQWNITENILV